MDTGESMQSNRRLIVACLLAAALSSSAMAQDQEQKAQDQKQEEDPGLAVPGAPGKLPTIQRPTNIKPPAVGLPDHRTGKTIEKGVKGVEPSHTTTQDRGTTKATTTKSEGAKATGDKAEVHKTPITDQKPTTNAPTVGNQQQAVSRPKPENVTHDPQHKEGKLGQAKDHQPVVIEKEGKPYRRSYYSLVTEGVTNWYWYDTPLSPQDPVLLTLTEIPVCGGITEDCPPRRGGGISYAKKKEQPVNACTAITYPRSNSNTSKGEMEWCEQGSFCTNDSCATHINEEFCKDDGGKCAEGNSGCYPSNKCKPDPSNVSDNLKVACKLTETGCHIGGGTGPKNGWICKIEWEVPAGKSASCNCGCPE
jgi:hypothetical protein